MEQVARISGQNTGTKMNTQPNWHWEDTPPNNMRIGISFLKHMEHKEMDYILGYKRSQLV